MRKSLRTRDNHSVTALSGAQFLNLKAPTLRQRLERPKRIFQHADGRFHIAGSARLAG
jgi:hypothetical protein